MQSPSKSEPNVACNGEDEDEYWPLSGKPYFNVFLTKTNLKPAYQLKIPNKISASVPTAELPAVLTYRGKKWEMAFNGTCCPKKFDGRWRHFAIDNNLNVDDVCVFELVDFEDGVIKFRVQILRAEFPAELLEKSYGATADSPLCLDD